LTAKKSKVLRLATIQVRCENGIALKFGGDLKKYLVAVVAATLLALNFTSSPASASTGCDSKEQTLVNAINSATLVSTITTAASAFRTCLSGYADSRNSYSSYFYTAGGFYYSIMTAANTYNYAGRSYAMKAAADYRMSLLGEESTINSRTGSTNCNTTYQNLIGIALGAGDIALASHAENAYDDCIIIRNLPSATPRFSYSGSLGVGTNLQGNSGTWPVNVLVNYQWFRGNSSISGATSSSYVVQAADAGYQIRLQVTGSRSGLTSVSRSTPYSNTILVPLTLTPTPTVTGTKKVGSALTAIPGTWDSGTSLSYIWLRDGAEISIATNSTYVLTSFDANRLISVKVTGTKQGHQSVSKTSDASRVLGSDLTLTPTPTFTGTKVVGNTLSATSGTWDSGVELSYQWLNDGNEISGATSSTYVLQGSDYQHQISVRVTGTKFGYTTTSKTSASTSVGIGTLVGSSVPIIFGTVATGRTLQAVMGIVDTGVTFEYQWLLDGQPIAGATSKNYDVAGSDYNRGLSVRMSAIKLGYQTLTGTSPVSQVAGTTQTLTPTPTISGTFKVGQTLVANAGTWGSGINVSYQWLRDGIAIPGATSASYTAVGEDYQKQLSVQVTGSALGFLTASTTSSAAMVAVSSLASSTKPVMDGSFQVGKEISCSPNSSQWDSGVSFEYIWLRDGVAFGGPNAEMYRLTPADNQRTIACRVIGTKLGYTPQTLTSNAVPVSPGVFNEYALLSGELKVGSTVTIDRNQWPAEATLTVQWYRTINSQGAFEAIAGETSLTHKITAAEAGREIWARIAISSPGYVTIDEDFWRGLITTGTQRVQTLGESNPPTFAGAKRVGSAISIGPGTWDAGTPTTITILGWDGSVAATASCVGSGNCVWFGPQVDSNGRFVPSALDLGFALTVTVTGTFEGVAATAETYMPIGKGLFDTSQMPAIQGAKRQGETLHVDIGAKFPGVEVTYQWGYYLATTQGTIFVTYSGESNPTFVTRFNKQKVDFGLRVTLASPGFESAQYDYPAIDVGFPLQTMLPTPFILGIPKVGSTLTANVGLTSATSNFVTWYRDGVLISSQSSFSYVVTRADFNRTITISVRAEREGYESATLQSSPLLISAGTMRVSTPSITGSVKVGKVVTAKTTAWVPGAAITYQWLLDGKAIKGATGKTFKALPSQKGRRLSLTVTQKLLGYVTATKTSSAIKIG
jgi:hypothetical protein